MRAEPEVIYEDPKFLIIAKPAGLLVHPAPVARDRKEAPQETLTAWLVERYPEVAAVGDDPAVRPGIVHRLDKETSGVMVIPRTQDYYLYLKSLFATRTIAKTYAALCSGIPKIPRGTIDRPIGMRSGSVKHSVHLSKNAKEAVTEYEVAEDYSFGEGRDAQKYSLVRAHPLTGRTHQIRVHLASIHCPVVGDPLYGAKKKPAWASRLYLHASSIEFSVSPGHMMRFEAPLPPEFSKAVDYLRTEAAEESHASA